MKNLLLLFFSLLFIFSSCKKKIVENIPVESVAIDLGKTAEVRMGATLLLTATVLPENASSKEVTWDSFDPSIATVSGGLVTPVKIGRVVISATAGGITANCTVTVNPALVAVTGISLVPTSVTISVKETSTLNATIDPDNATDKMIVWTSDKEDIATVSDGVVTAKAEGTCTITAKSFSDQTKTAACQVTVVAQVIPVTGISLEKTANILVNETRKLNAILQPENATNKSVTWSTSNAAVAEVSPAGIVTAKSVGSANITAASVSNPDKTAICAVTVTNQGVAVTSFSVAPADTTIAVRASFQIRHKIEPVNATNFNVTYESSDVAKATVSESGLVTAGSSISEATITVKSVADPTKMSICRLNIKARVASITVSPNAAEISVGQTRQLTATVMPTEAATKTVIWSSANISKASVSPTGVVTAVGPGQVLITATAKDGSNVSGSSTITVRAPFVAVAGVIMNPQTVNIVIGQTSTLSATIAPATATNKLVVWTSNREDIATVSAGIITARALGTCVITAKSSNDPTKMATCAVTVVPQPIPVTTLSVTPVAATILVNDTRELIAGFVPENATNKNVTWSTSNAAVAEVSATGVVTAKSAGTATITATSADNTDKNATCAITVTNREVAVTGLTVVPTDTTIAVNSSFQLVSKIEPATATNVNVTYLSSDEAKAIFSASGLVTAVAIGEATITVKSVADPTKLATCHLTIKARVESITLAPRGFVVTVGERQQLTAAVLPVDAANKTLTWSSSDPSKATISQGGEVTGVAPGRVDITATAKDGSSIVGEAIAMVVPRATSITIAPENPALNQEETLELRATVLPSGTYQTVTWSSGDVTKATINATTGVVRGVGPGTVTITATSNYTSGVTGTVTLTVRPPLPLSTATITGLTLGAENYVVAVPNQGGTTTVNNAPHTVVANPASVQVNITATAGALIKIGNTDFSSGNMVNCTGSVTFTVTQAGTRGSKEYTLNITPYNMGSNAYGIYTLAHLHDMRNALSSGFKLMTDLTMPAASAGFTGISDYAAEGWLPIGDGANPFTGALDGAGHKIENLYVNRKTKEYAGLFGKMSSSSAIRRLGVRLTGEANKGVGGENRSRSGNQYGGGLAGYSEGTIEDCYTEGGIAFAGTVYAGTAYAGGLVGYATGQINRCYSTALVTSTSVEEGSANCYSGGLVGNSQRATFNDCYATGKVYAFVSVKAADSYAGGLIGESFSGEVNRCYATGEVFSQSQSETDQLGAYAGGIVARTANTRFKNCYAMGKVTGKTLKAANSNFTFTGGFAGRSFGGHFHNSYAAGNVESEGAKNQWIGGVVGLSQYETGFRYCYRKIGITKKRGSNVEPDDKDLVIGTSIWYMVMEGFKDDLNQGQSIVWGKSGGKNSNMPYIIGVGEGK